jgi:D-galactarolactone cycloisomerase
MVHASGVEAHDLGLFVVRYALQDVRQDFARLGKRRLAVRIVRAPHHVVDADHAGQAEVRRSTTIPIASGEREFTRFDFQDLLERRALDIAQPDVARAGGLTEIRRIAALTSAHGVRLAPHAWGSGVLFAASIHVAMAAPNCHILEVSQGYMPMMWELFDEPFDIRPDGMVHAPERPGLGFTLRADALERFGYVDGPEYKF